MRKITLKDGTVKKVYDLKRTPLKRSEKPIKKVSEKQAKNNSELSKVKKTMPQKCFYSGCSCKDLQLMHILNKGSYPEFKMIKENFTLGCQEHHNLFDDDVQFRQTQMHLYYQIKPFAKRKADNYFQFNK